MSILEKPDSKTNWTDSQLAYRSEPDAIKKDNGYITKEKLGYKTFNWLIWIFGQWIDYLESLTDYLFLRIKITGNPLNSLANKKERLASKEFVLTQPNPRVFNGNLVYLSADDQGDSYYDSFSDGDFVYVACAGGGLRAYLINSDGTLTFLDSNDQGGNYYSVFGDGRFVYASCNDVNGIRSYSVDEKGNLTHIDYDNQGGTYSAGCSDGRFIYICNAILGLLVYKSDNQGKLTFIGSDYQGVDAYAHCWSNGKFIFVACRTGGIRTYSVDDNGILTYIDIDYQGGDYRMITGDSNFIYVACYTDGLRSYKVDKNGYLTCIDTEYQSDAYTDVHCDGRFIYITCGAGGVKSYSSDISGNLAYINGDNQGGNNYHLSGYGDFIFVSCLGDGLRLYKIATAYEYDPAENNHSFNGSIGIGTAPDSNKAIKVAGLEENRFLGSHIASTVQWMKDYVSGNLDGTDWGLGIKFILDAVQPQKFAGIASYAVSSWADAVGLKFFTTSSGNIYNPLKISGTTVAIQNFQDRIWSFNGNSGQVFDFTIPKNFVGFIIINSVVGGNTGHECHFYCFSSDYDRLSASQLHYGQYSSAFNVEFIDGWGSHTMRITLQRNLVESTWVKLLPFCGGIAL
ncbi:MAG: lactonase family protein [bacterium]|nr:lactonase family protein [bacterium]